MKLLLHPLPVRIFHWTTFFCITTLMLTGLYLHEPFQFLHLPVILVRKLHGICALLLSTTLFGQIYYYTFTAKFTEILLLPRDWSSLRSFLRYYLFITAHHPNFGRYNPGQKLVFTSWAIAVLAAIFTGGLLLLPEQFLQLQRLLGGLAAIRLMHYTIMMFFLGTLPLHIYLVFTEEPAKLQAMFTGWINKEISNKSRSGDKRAGGKQ